MYFILSGDLAVIQKVEKKGQRRGWPCAYPKGSQTSRSSISAANPGGEGRGNEGKETEADSTSPPASSAIDAMPPIDASRPESSSASHHPHLLPPLSPSPSSSPDPKDSLPPIRNFADACRLSQIETDPELLSTSPSFRRPRQSSRSRHSTARGSGAQTHRDRGRETRRDRESDREHGGPSSSPSPDKKAGRREEGAGDGGVKGDNDAEPASREVLSDSEATDARGSRERSAEAEQEQRRARSLSPARSIHSRAVSG